MVEGSVIGDDGGWLTAAACCSTREENQKGKKLKMKTTFQISFFDFYFFN